GSSRNPRVAETSALERPVELPQGDSSLGGPALGRIRSVTPKSCRGRHKAVEVRGARHGRSGWREVERVSWQETQKNNQTAGSETENLASARARPSAYPGRDIPIALST
ncbi:hypothetical protein THAOC_03402, partial [Thalassiosira oceanica]